jgi:hypothetical protein
MQHPHNAQYELYNEWLFDEATRLTRALDAQFGRRNKTVAILVRSSSSSSSSVCCLVCFFGVKEAGACCS